MIAPADVTGVVLAGGRGRRMGGIDKGWLTLDGVPLIEYVLTGLDPQVGEVVISANRHLERYRKLGHAVAVDPEPGYLGPLTGALGAMHLVTTSWTVMVPVDMPRLPCDLVARLAAARGEADIVVAHDGDRLQPLVALLRTSLRDDLATWLAKGEAKVLLWYERHRWSQADFSDCATRFANLNTPEEHAKAQESVGGGGIDG